MSRGGPPRTCQWDHQEVGDYHRDRSAQETTYRSETSSSHSLSHLSLVEQHDPNAALHQEMMQQVAFSTLPYTPFIPYPINTPVHTHPGYYHPYRACEYIEKLGFTWLCCHEVSIADQSVDASMRTPQSFHATAQSFRPPLTTSPPGSAGSIRPDFQQVAMQGISPTTVSPPSAIGSSLSDLSPISVQAHSLPTSPILHPTNLASSLMTATASPGIGPNGDGRMAVTGFAKPVRSNPTRELRPKQIRRNTVAGLPMKQEIIDEDDELESEEGDDIPDMGADHPRR